MERIYLTERISYIKATHAPLSADVGIIEGEKYIWLYDVGSSDEVADYLNGADFTKEKNLVISHFHPDHLANWSRIPHREIYQGVNTKGYTHSGIAVEQELVLQDGLELRLFPIPACHAKGSLGLMAGEYAFLGDATYSTHKKGQAVYNAQMLREQIRVLHALPVKYFLLSHDEKFCYEKESVLADLEAIYARRIKNEPYIQLPSSPIT